MRYFFSLLVLTSLISCAHTPDQMWEGGYITATPILPPQETAILISAGFQKCTEYPANIQPTGNNTYSANYVPAYGADYGFWYVIDISADEVRIAPWRQVKAMRQMSGLVAEWVETGEIHCDLKDSQLARWDK